MISYNDALQIIRQAASAHKLAAENMPLPQAAGRICAESLFAPRAVQPFDNAAMDGFAVSLADFAIAPLSERRSFERDKAQNQTTAPLSEKRSLERDKAQNRKTAPQSANALPIILKKGEIIAAGQDASGLQVGNGFCLPIMTGAMLPKGAEAVIPVENAEISGGSVIFRAKPQAGQHIRRAGEDFRKGDLVLSAGDIITAARLLPLAALGIAEISVFNKPNIFYIPTGAEIIDNLATPLRLGQIYDANRFCAEAFLTECGADVAVSPIIRDSLPEFIAALRRAEAENYDIIISSGAVSAGDFDFVRAGLEQFGARILYHKIRMRPGKPNLLAVLPSGALYFGLPGNPAACAAGLRFFAAEALRIMRRQKAETPIYARAANQFSKNHALHMILKGQLHYEADGTAAASVLSGQESFKTSPFLQMNCWIHMQEEQNIIHEGDIIEAYPLPCLRRGQAE